MTVGGSGSLARVTFASPTDGWAVGQYLDGSSAWHALAGHWDGSRWLPVKSGISATERSALSGVIGTEPSAATAVGYEQRGTEFKRLVGTP